MSIARIFMALLRMSSAKRRQSLWPGTSRAGKPPLVRSLASGATRTGVRVNSYYKQGKYPLSNGSLLQSINGIAHLVPPIEGEAKRRGANPPDGENILKEASTGTGCAGPLYPCSGGLS